MSEVEIPEYVPGAPWKAVVRSSEGQAPVILKIWAVDAAGTPHHADVVFALDEAFEGVVCVASYDRDGLKTKIYPPVDDVAAVQSLLRERIPDIDFGTDDDWIFG